LIISLPVRAHTDAHKATSLVHQATIASNAYLFFLAGSVSAGVRAVNMTPWRCRQGFAGGH
jgi:hypothetical protein